MDSGPEANRIRQIVDALSRSAEGQYETRLDFASEGDSLGSIANAVNTLLEKTDNRISAISQLAEDLALDSRRYRNILNSLGETYFETDLKGHLLFFNGRALEVLGYTREELDGLHFHHLMDEVSAGKVYEAFHNVFVTGRPNKGFEWEILKKNKEILDVESSVALLHDKRGEAVGFRGVIRDISKHKQIERSLRQEEERYRNILENMADTYLETDLKGNFTFFNDSLCRTLGYSREQLQGINYRLIAPPERVQDIYHAFNEIYTTGRQKTFMEYKLAAGDGSIIYLEFSMSLLRSPTGEPIGFSGFGRNITEQVKARRKVEESERHLRLITDNISDIIWTMNFDLRLTYLSTSTLRLTGFTPEELMNMPLEAVVPPEMHDGFRQVVADELSREHKRTLPKRDRPITVELPLSCKNGSVLWVEANVTFNRDENGRAFEIIGVTRDITERKRAEEHLRESEERYRTILESIGEGYWEVDLKGRFTFFNDTMCEISHQPREYLMGIEAVRNATPETAKKMSKAFDEVYRTGIPIELTDYEIIKGDGTKGTYEMRASLMRDKEGSPIGFRGITRDVTRRKAMEEALAESEQRYRMIVENMHDVVMLVGLDLKEKYRSPSATQLTGYSLEEIAEIPLQDQVTPESYALVEGILAEELEKEFGGAPVDPRRLRTLELEVYHKDGGTVWIEETASFLRDADGKPTEILIVARDITERKRLKEEKDKLEGQLIQAQKMETVGRLAGGVAHDFNNMLSVILGYVGLVKLRLAKEHPVLSDILEIEKAAIRSRDITSQLLAFSRKQIITPQVINLNDLIFKTQKSLIRLIGEDIELRVFPGEGLWRIRFDLSQIEQILFNLAVNARDAMPGGGKLTIETKNITLDNLYCEQHGGFTPGRYVRLSISDNGAGMDQETLQHIFEPFFTTKEVGKGTGLGLPTVYGIVKQNNSFIDVYSEQGYGTTVTIYVPCTADEKEAPQESEEKPAVDRTGNILLVEDNPMVLEITKEMLEHIGYSVMIAENPGDAMSLCETHDAIDLVITDVVMPTMSGGELKNRLVDIRPDMTVLFMSGYSTDAIAHHGVLEKGVHFLQKPFTLNDLACKVEEAMRKSRTAGIRDSL